MEGPKTILITTNNYLLRGANCDRTLEIPREHLTLTPFDTNAMFILAEVAILHK